MLKLKSRVSLLFVLSFFLACESEKKKEIPAIASPPVIETKVNDTTTFANAIDAFDSKMGVAGLFDVPEMLVLSLLDSAAKKDLPDKMVANYALLEKEMGDVGAEMNGPIGLISYNNNPDNFIFETVLCIKQVPKKQPQKSNIIILEASKMLVYNFYGPYQNLFGAYDKIQKYCKKNDLLQSGPIREFYITDPALEKNSEKWLTRIFLPVVSLKK